MSRLLSHASLLNRRQAIWIGLAGLPWTQSVAAGPADPATPVAPSTVSSKTDGWVRSSLKRKKVLGPPLELRRFKDRYYALLAPTSWKDTRASSPLQRVDVPAGFVTDFASIPGVFWSVLPPDGDYAHAAVIHDYLYWVQDRKREEADEILRQAMIDLEVKNWQRIAIYKGVDLFGQSAWDKNLALKDAGEKRILKRFPTDARLTFSEWKKQKQAYE